MRLSATSGNARGRVGKGIDGVLGAEGVEEGEGGTGGEDWDVGDGAGDTVFLQIQRGEGSGAGESCGAQELERRCCSSWAAVEGRERMNLAVLELNSKLCRERMKVATVEKSNWRYGEASRVLAPTVMEVAGKDGSYREGSWLGSICSFASFISERLRESRREGDGRKLNFFNLTSFLVRGAI